MAARLECDRCELGVEIDAQGFDEIVDADPWTDQGGGLVLLRCSAWPRRLLARAGVQAHAVTT